MVKNLHSYITLYLNRLIHGLLTISKQFHQRQIDRGWDDWKFPPNLISFKIGDLVRCKMSSKEKQIVKVFKQIRILSDKNPEKIKIIRIKNRLKQGTNDILINIKFNNSIICQIQLEVINKTKSKFIQCSNAFSHYIYEMKRSIFGPVTELCSIWSNFQARSSEYQALINQPTESETKISKCIDDNSAHSLVKFDLPFQCYSCHHLYYHNNYFISNKKCEKCHKYQCVKCQIDNMEQTQLKKIIFPKRKDKELSESSKKLIGKNLPTVGVCMKIQSTIPKVEIFKVSKYEGKTWLLGQKQGQIYCIKKIKSQKDTIQFLQKYCIFQVHKNFLKFINISQNMIEKFSFQQYLKNSFKEQKQVLIFTQLRPKASQFTEIFNKNAGYEKNRKKITRIEYASNYSNQISFLFGFENLREINLDYNRLKDLKEIYHFKQLQKLQIRQNSTLNIFNQQVCYLQKLQEIKIRVGIIEKLPKDIDNLSQLKILSIQKNKISKLPKSIVNLSNLQLMSFQSNKIQSLPQEFGKLVSLKKLILRNNSIKQYPSSMKQLNNLLVLDISKNTIDIFPDILAHLSNLETLLLQGNLLKELPEKFVLCNKIKTLSLSSNKFVSLPDSFRNLKHLEEFYLHSNLLEDLPPSIGECVNLKKFTIHDNKLKMIPIWYSKLKNLQPMIDFQKNNLSQIPKVLFEIEGIKNIQLKYNLITVIPDEINLLQQLTYLGLSHNKIQKLSSNLVELIKLTKFDISYNEIIKVPLFIKDICLIKKQPKTWNKYFINNKIKQFESGQLFDIQIPVIELTNNKLQYIPYNLIDKKINIVKINFANNNIKQIGRQIVQFINLKSLNLSYNFIEKIEKYLELLVNMDKKQLHLQQNKITIIQCPEFVKKYGSLHTCNMVDRLQSKDIVDEGQQDYDSDL